MDIREENGVEIHRVVGVAEGIHFTALGAVHGNEKCGTLALNRIKQNILDGKIRIKAGSFTFIPITNPRAYEQDVRFTERNLNRSMYRKPVDEIAHYEDTLDNVVCPILEKTDYLLDLHSCTSKSEAFLIVGGGDENMKFARVLGVPRIISGWSDAVKKNEDVIDKRHADGTTEYARLHGATALTLECGNHAHPRGADAGYQAVLNTLDKLGIADIDPDLFIDDIFDGEAYDIQLKSVFMKTREGALLQDWNNMHPVTKGTPVARYDDGEEILMPDDGFIVLPNKNAVVGAEWFFWGKPSKLKP